MVKGPLVQVTLSIFGWVKPSRDPQRDVIVNIIRLQCDGQCKSISSQKTWFKFGFAENAVQI